MSSVKQLTDMWEKKASEDREKARGDANNYNTSMKVSDINSMMVG